LSKIQKLYKNDKNQLYGFAEKVEKGIQEVNRFEYTKETEAFETEILQNEMTLWSSRWDTINGGEHQNQKFITPAKFNYIQQYHHLNKDKKIGKYLYKTLENIALSGIVDHLEGGFYRYTVDTEWKIPHFEKMLYDNAQLLTLFSNAYKEFKKPLFKTTVYSIFNFLINRMENSQGAFYSAIDADNNQGEGRYYVFNAEEIKNVGGDDLNLLQEFYQIDLDNPFEEEYYHLRKSANLTALGLKYKLTVKQLNEKRADWKNQFEALKNERDFPLIDNKIITSWNAMTISGLVNAYGAFDDDRFLLKATQTFTFIEDHLIRRKKLMHTFQANQAKIEASLEDYAFTIKAALDLYQNTGGQAYLDRAVQLTQTAIKNFENDENPFFTFTKNPVLFSEIISVDDNVIPSANAIMAENLWVLGQLIENEDYTRKAKKMLDGIISYFSEGRGSDYSQWAQLLAKEAYSYKEVVIVGSEAQKTSRKLQQHYLPNILFQISEKESELPLLKDRYFDEETLIYVCENKVCLRPTKTISEALKQINN